MNPTKILIPLLLVTVVPSVFSQQSSSGVIFGADPGEGLDLLTETGSEFVYTVNIGGDAPIEVGELTFTVEDATPGVTRATQHHILAWDRVNDFGANAPDQGLAQVLHSIRYSDRPNPVEITLADVEVGRPHKLQVLFSEKCCDRGFDVLVDGELVADDFNPGRVAGGSHTPQSGAFVAYEFVPESSTVTLTLDGRTQLFPDGNAIISGLTLEALSVDEPNLDVFSRFPLGQAPAVPSVRTLPLRNSGTSSDLTITEVRITGAHAANFSVENVPSTLAPGEAADMEIHFDSANVAGGFFATLEILSDDPSDPILTVELSADVRNQNGPVALYALDEASIDDGLRDSSGNSRNGTFNSGTGTIDFQQAGLASGESVAFANQAEAVIPGTSIGALDSFTIATWFNAESVSGETLQTLVAKGTIETPSFALVLSNSSIGWYSGGDTTEFATDAIIEAETTYHVAFVYDNTTGNRKATIYIDGVEAATMENPLEIEDTEANDVFVAGYGETGALPYSGTLDDLHLYGRTLDADEISFIINNPGVAAGTNGDIDSDGDGLLDEEEVTAGSDPLLPDTDDDGVKDLEEVTVHNTDPNVADTDGDGASDSQEILKGTDPTDASSTPSAYVHINPLSGADPGEGLDMEGTFLYAVNMAGGGGQVIGDATFTNDAETGGVSVVATAQAIGWFPASYGSNEGDNALEVIMGSIRYSGSPDDVTIDLADLNVGQQYKLQLLFAEAGWNRGFDILIDGVLEVDEFAPWTYHGIIAADPALASTSPTGGVVVNYEFIAGDTSLSIVLSNDDINFPDPTPIIQALTLELIVDEGDSDSDGLDDGWEILHFGDLAQTSDGDADEDGLTNLKEFDATTDPNASDTDGDGLSDGDEINTHTTDPLVADMDRDGLTDGAEINTHGTDPTVRDTDGDDIGDGAEISKGSNPIDNTSIPDAVLEATVFTGGEPGEGLDFEGTFVHAMNFAGPGGLQLGDAVFTDENAEGITWVAPNNIPNFFTASYGDTDADNVLEQILASIRWAASPDMVQITVSQLVLGQRYKMQMLFGEQGSDRGWDIVIDDVVEAEGFNPGRIHNLNRSAGVVATYSFVAQASSVNIVLDNTAGAFPDNNPIIQALTVESLGGDDTDSDGLSDEWEVLHFGDLSATPEADVDEDGLTNIAELNANTDPNVLDTDADGLSDGDEVNTHTTNPLFADTDYDGVNDSEEISSTMTDPLARDSDGDDIGDGTEIREGTDPLDAESSPEAVVDLIRFTGGDPGEGLDFQGNFIYAVNMAGPAGPVIGNATFTDENTAGINWVAISGSLDWFGAADYGDTVNDTALSQVMRSIRWSTAPEDFLLDIEGLEVGESYKLQLLFAEACCERGFDIFINGELEADEFSPRQYNMLAPNAGVSGTYTFTAESSELNIVLSGNSATFADLNPILQAFTVEVLDGSVVTPPGQDTDGDGVADEDEALAGTDPNNSSEYLRVTATARTESGIEITWAAVDGKSYDIEFSETMEPGTWNSIATDLAGTAGLGSFEDTDAERTSGEGYYRAVVK